MTPFLVAFTALIIAILAAFRLKMNRMRKTCPIRTMLSGAVAETAQVTESLKGELTATEIAARVAAAKSREPKSKEPPTEELPKIDRNAATTVAAPVLLLIMAGLFLLGGWVRERASSAGEMRAGYVKGWPANSLPAGGRPAGIHETGRTDLSARPQFDAKLAELRERPTLATVVWLRLNTPADRRGQVASALRDVAGRHLGPVSIEAEYTLIRWGVKHV